MSDDNFACELPRHHSTDDEIRAILEDYRVIAVVGLSTDASRPTATGIRSTTFGSAASTSSWSAIVPVETMSDPGG